MFPSVHDLLEHHFFPCAPLSSSLGLCQSLQFWTWAWVRSLLLEEVAVGAFDEEENIVGVVLGKHSLLLDLNFRESVIDFIFGGGWEEFVGEWIVRLCWYLNWLLPAYYADHTYGLFRDIEQRLGYDENKIMTSLNCHKVRELTHLVTISVPRPHCLDGCGVPALCGPEIPEARSGHQPGPGLSLCSNILRL